MMERKRRIAFRVPKSFNNYLGSITINTRHYSVCKDKMRSRRRVQTGSINSPESIRINILEAAGCRQILIKDPRVIVPSPARR